MPERFGRAGSYWVDPALHSGFPRLDGDQAVEVAVIGGGIVGLTTAYLLARAGVRVAVLEARRVGAQVTGGSTAKVTALHGLIYDELIADYGQGGARTYARANQQAIETIAGLVDELGADCDFRRTTAYTYSEDGRDLDRLRREVEAANRVGLAAELVSETPLPFPVAGAVQLAGQAAFHPYRYALALADGVVRRGSLIYEHCRVQNVEDGTPLSVVTAQGTVRADHVVVATNLPILDRGGLFARAFPRRHMAVAAAVAPDRAPEGIFLSATAPSRSIRCHRGAERTVLIAVGEGFKTGHADTEEKLAELAAFVRRHFAVGEISHFWGNQDYYAADRVPYVGPLTPLSSNLHTATGFSAWGITNGTAAATILADAILERPNAWAEFFRASRLRPRLAGPEMVRQNLHVAREWAHGRLGSTPSVNLAEIPAGGQAVIDGPDGKTAVHRDAQGRLHSVSAVCTHLGCTVTWNVAERSWDCPCHGSRFTPDGRVLNGPAVSDLAARPVADR